MNIIFLGGIFTKEQSSYIKLNSIGPIQYAADALQKNYLDGLTRTCGSENVIVINLPFIGGYPGNFKKLFYTPLDEKFIFLGSTVKNISFLNVKGIKNISRLIKSFKEVRAISKGKQDVKIICYSMHIPFLLCCYLCKLLNNNLAYYIIIPDLPEFMMARVGLKKILYNFINRISYYIVNKSNGISVITEKMKSKFNEDLSSVVIEGIASENLMNECYSDDNSLLDDIKGCKYFLYTGTLDKRYGIRSLLTAYINSGVSDVKLVICGDGDDKNYLLEKSKEYKNIIYLGQLSRECVISLQINAYVLVNPRDNSSEFTKYSFPSKTIEYMMSGVPVLMFKLDGIPDEYSGCFFEIKDEESFSYMIKYIAGLSLNELNFMGKKAKSFILENKLPEVQVRKMISMMLKN